MATKSATGAKVSPLADRVVVKPLEETEQMRGGLYIPDTAKEKPQQGEIVAVGPGRFEKASAFRWTSRSATRCCTGSTAAPKSRSTASRCSFFASPTSSP